MRLAQIARKVQVKPSEIRSFVKKTFDVELDVDPNIKLEDAQVKAILEEFKVEEVEPVVEVVEEKVVEVVEDDIDSSIDTDIDALKEVAEITEKVAPAVKAKKVEKKVEEVPEAIEEKVEEKVEEVPEAAEEVVEEVVEEKVVKAKKAASKNKKAVDINYDDTEGESAKEEDPSSFEEVKVDEDAELIAAPVAKLEGLKVVGKIDLGTEEPEEEELPSVDDIEEEIDGLDGEVDTSTFTDKVEGETDQEKDALFAELDAQMDSGSAKEVKKAPAAKVSTEVSDNIDDEEEYSIYKNERGIYRFSAEQRKNREISLSTNKDKAKAHAQKSKKKRHYQENVAVNAKPVVKKKINKPAKKAMKAEAAAAEPKGVWKKFLRWLND